MAGTASTVRSFLLVEHPGPWGVDALRDARMPEGIGPELRARAAATRTKVVLIRRPAGASRGAEGIRVFAAWAHHTEPWLETTLLDDLGQVHDLDLEALAAGRSMGLDPHPDPVLAVCTHGRHDTCCAERGRPVAAALTATHPAETWEISHMGGDRFAANMVVLPEGLYYGRMDPGSASDVAWLHEAGRVDIGRLRGRSSYPMHVQYAEIALRRHLEVDRLDAVRLVRRQGWTCVFGHDEGAEAVEWAVTVSRRTQGEAQLTCGLDRLSPVPVHDVVSIRRLP